MHLRCELIVAYDKNGAIGASSTNSIPWHVPEDLAHFRQITTETPNSVIVMGRKTFESFGGKPLKDRIHIVLTKNPALHRGNFKNVHFADYCNIPIFSVYTRKIAYSSSAVEKSTTSFLICAKSSTYQSSMSNLVATSCFHTPLMKHHILF